MYSFGNEFRYYNKYLIPKITPIKFNPKLPNCIICDIDGTIAKMSDRSPYEWHKVGQDTPIESTINILETLKQNTKIFFFSGRSSICRNETLEWLSTYIKFTNFTLIMRPENDKFRPDTEIKLEMYQNHIENQYKVIAVFDDRLSVCRQWHNLGLPLFRVGDPESNF